ncbi:4-hydroxy-tetrahydrodipicolinate synthase [Paenibacillus sp. N4]|uniref:4-hydroxy-tetrahydrodipicolinate synthase n=1 Tax=Paenibacillus vietnamensis TaxID=2590547 RepID=UPI001CD129C4|nr:4-hydroxy-tetrahydrodipicolinate synthase [Paenibacillus vietnamensis]MCA0756887.1 4-hydroxy-tetrahydrodipicolinate synthase [Paenibacillus vietnamensis]
MDASWINGVIPPLVTPVDAEENVDEQGLRTVVDYVLAGGVHGLLSLGSNGEFYGLDHERQERAVAITLDQTAGRVPVYMGIGAITTKECVKLARMGERLGVQALTVLPPMFLTPSEEELYRHFAAIAEATSLPVLLYNNPDRVGNNISVRLLGRLSDIPNIAGIKDSSGDLTLTAEYIRTTRHKNFRVMAGRDVMILGSLAYGAAGCVASTANIVPSLVVDIYNKFKAGDLAGALEAQFTLAPLRMAFNLASFPVVTKEAMQLMGLPVGEPILPNTACTGENRGKLKGILQEMGVL